MDSLQAHSNLLVFFHKREKDIKDSPLSLQVSGLVASQELHNGEVREYSFNSTEAQFTHNLRTCIERQGLAQYCSVSLPLTGQNNACVMSVDGMTCNSCVKLIESTISEMAGVASIKVSLQFKKAFVEYNPGVVKPAELTGCIYDMGFDAEVLTTHGLQADDVRNSPNLLLSPEIQTEGESTKTTHPLSGSGVIEGVSHVSKAKGLIPIEIQELADSIQECGTSPTSPGHGMLSGRNWNAEKLKVCHVGIDGMTCQSCVSLIESVVGELEGVVSVSVSLACKEGTVKFNSASISPDAIGKAVDEMGFCVTYITGM